MRVLLATPVFSQHFDSGLFWAAALSRLGQHLLLWDYRTQDDPPAADYDLALVMKGAPEIASRLARPRACYWPDAFDRTPGLKEQLIKAYDKVFTPVRPTPAGMEWLPTGWDPLIHLVVATHKAHDSIFVGTGTPHKAEWLATLRPQLVCGNSWAGLVDWETSPAIYLYNYVGFLQLTKVAINLHRDEGIGLNRRFFEMMACTFTITDRAPGVVEVLGEELSSMVSFATPQEGKKMLDFYLKHEAERKIAWERELQAIRPYTYDAAVANVVKAMRV